MATHFEDDPRSITEILASLGYSHRRLNDGHCGNGDVGLDERCLLNFSEIFARPLFRQ